MYNYTTTVRLDIIPSTDYVNEVWRHISRPKFNKEYRLQDTYIYFSRHNVHTYNSKTNNTKLSEYNFIIRVIHKYKYKIIFFVYYSDDGIIFRKLSVVSFWIVYVNIVSNKINISVLASVFIVNIIQNCLPINNLKRPKFMLQIFFVQQK